jgi:hypothetical protein
MMSSVANSPEVRGAEESRKKARESDPHPFQN